MNNPNFRGPSEDPFVNLFLNIATSRCEIDRVIYNGPATIVFWDDGDKTVVKCHEGDTYDKEKGLAFACMKKMYGNKGKWNDILREFTK